MTVFIIRPLRALVAGAATLCLGALLAMPAAAQQASAGNSGNRPAAAARASGPARLAAGASASSRQRGTSRGEGRFARIDTTVAADARVAVTIAAPAGRVVVRSWDRPQVRVVASVDGGGIDFDASAMRVRVGTSRRGGDDARYEVTMPAGGRLEVAGVNTDVVVSGVHGGVEVESANGDVRLDDVGGLVRLQLMNGAVRVARGDGDFRLGITSGDAVLQDVAGRIEVASVSGSVVVRGARARELRLETTSGNLTYDGTVVADGRYELVTHSGDVRLRLPEGVRARLEADTYSGEFRSDFPVTMQPGAPRGTRQRRAELLVGDGNGPLIRVGSFSGDIHLARGTSAARPDSTR